MSHETPKPKLWIEGGEIHCGDCLYAEYLLDWQNEHGHPDGTPIRVLTEENFQNLIARADMAGIA